MKRVALLMSLMLVTGCSYFQNRYAQKPEIDLAKIYFQDTTPLSTTMVFVLSVKNPNKIDFNVDEMTYEIQLDGKEFAKARNDKKTKIPAGETAMLEVPLPVNFLKAMDGIAKVISGQDVGYEINGNAKVSGFSVPFNEKGQFNMNGLKK
ncbi:LEA type 2 family protein [Bdellovibrio sp. SKB1291214]|uniref:LEA type 2 family protein n=1 Tax=Bdellovibrio sp. SKB1291214 TaxID=1732569 RepID=UPI000B51C5C3|nr:LEA type 2 family protein [Bdellovibrio sp. SKB1291214]UYL09530.1 LEA type 2 family protein [Bdellovibrio sp. SKB1291214]